MSEQTYTPEEVEATRRTIQILRSTHPSAEVLAVADEIESNIDEQRTRDRRRKTGAARARRSGTGAAPAMKASAAG